ncbi:MAG: hypothetical protein JWQ38_3401, partial [Flavipsychrobacter sp.]|nr:hypothetical protein [Flavipsychrobacter sp.]
SLALGDTIKDPATGEASGVIDFVDSVSISGVYHKRFNFGRYPTGALWTGGAWIEGIGNSSLGGLLGSAMAQPTCDCATETVCYKEGSDWKYHNAKYSTLDCINVLQAPTITAHEAKVMLYPDPVINTATLHIDGNASYFQLVICNMQGRIEKSIAVHDQENVTIGKDNCPVGMHIYRLQDDKGNVTTGKFIVE